MAKPFIAAYKAGASSPDQFIESDQLIYWYRPALGSLNCDATDNTMKAKPNDATYMKGKPDGWNQMSDSVFVVALLASAGTVKVTSGSNTVTFDAPAGATAFEVPMGVGAQQFALLRNSQTVLSGRSLRDVSNVCPCGIYNFNAYVGTLPDGMTDALEPDGLSSLTVGLAVTTCAPKPSLGTAYQDATVVTTPESSPTGTKSTSTSTTSSITSPPRTSPKLKALITTTSKPISRTLTKPWKTTTIAAAATVCVEGTKAAGASDNLSGLCSYTCHFNYCPPGPCVCTKYATVAVPEPASLGVAGCPAPGLDANYVGLCSYTCNHGYCPPGACVQC